MNDKIDLADFEKAAGTYALADMDITSLIRVARAALRVSNCEWNESLAAQRELGAALSCLTDSAEVRHGQG